jgi:hypothetical protein
MKRLIGILVAVTFGAMLVLPTVAAAAGMRDGDAFKVRLDSGISGSMKSGETVTVTVPEAFQVDPKGQPVLPAGLAGTITVKMGATSDKGTKFDVSEFTFMNKGKAVVIPVHLADPAAGMATSHGASFIKKLLLPPLLGFLIWHGSSSPDAGSDLALEVTKSARW